MYKHILKKRGRERERVCVWGSEWVKEKEIALASIDDSYIYMILNIPFLWFQEMYGSNPLNLVRVVKNCLSTEERLVQQAENVSIWSMIIISA